MENELEKRAKYHKKRQKGLSPFYSPDGGNVPLAIDRFNSSTAEGANGLMGESLEEDFNPLKELVLKICDFLWDEGFAFPGDDLLADDWNNLKDGVEMGIDPLDEVAQFLVGYLEDTLDNVAPEFYNTINSYYKTLVKYIGNKSLEEDTVKNSDGTWSNKGDEGSHGKFKTKKQADNQRKAMFANGYRESLEEDFDDLDKKKLQVLRKKGFNDNGVTYVFLGNTYDRKEEIKQLGGKFDNVLGWHIDREVPGFEFFSVKFDDVADDVDTYGWGEIIYNNDASKLISTLKNKNKPAPKTVDSSGFVGEVGLKYAGNLTLKKASGYAANFGYRGTWVNIFIFEDDEGNNFVWKTSKDIDLEEDEEYFITGIIKDHSEYRGIKQTVLKNCKVTPLNGAKKKPMDESLDENSLEKELGELFKENRLWVEDYSVNNGKVYVYISDGDWKHEHLRCKWLVNQFLEDKGLITKDYREKQIGYSDGDTYNAEHIWYITDEDDVDKDSFKNLTLFTADEDFEDESDDGEILTEASGQGSKFDSRFRAFKKGTVDTIKSAKQKIAAAQQAQKNVVKFADVNFEKMCKDYGFLKNNPKYYEKIKTYVIKRGADPAKLADAIKKEGSTDLEVKDIQKIISKYSFKNASDMNKADYVNQEKKNKATAKKLDAKAAAMAKQQANNKNAKANVANKQESLHEDFISLDTAYEGLIDNVDPDVADDCIKFYNKVQKALKVKQPYDVYMMLDSDFQYDPRTYDIPNLEELEDIKSRNLRGKKFRLDGIEFVFEDANSYSSPRLYFKSENDGEDYLYFINHYYDNGDY